MKAILEHRLIPVVILLALSLYLFFFQLGKLALTDPDETFYGQTAKEMLKRGEWSTPYIHDKPQFEKPILFYWLVEASFKLFGVKEYSARLPSAVFGFLGLVAIYLLGSLLFNKRVGIFSAVILATNVEYIILSRACVTDMVLSTLMLLGILFFFYGRLRDRGYFYALSAAALGLATLTKGPIGVLLPVAIIFFYLVLTQDLRSVGRIPIGWCITSFLAVSLPWYILMYNLHGKAFIDAFFGFQNVTRFLESEHKIGSQFYYNIPILLGGLFPWSAFLPFGLWRISKKAFEKDSGHRKGAILSIIWFAVIFIFFSISSTKLPTYIFPLFPSLALIVGYVWDEFLNGGSPQTVARAMRWSYYLLLAVVIVGIAGLYLFIHKRYHTILLDSAIAGVFLLFGFLLPLAAFRVKKFPLVFLSIVFSVIIFIYPLVKLVIPQIDRYEASRDISRRLLSLADKGDTIGSESHYRSGLAFYTDRYVADLDVYDEMVKFMNSEKRVWCVIKEKNHIQLYEWGPHRMYVKPSYMVYKLGKKCIVTNNIPRDENYIQMREMPPR